MAVSSLVPAAAGITVSDGNTAGWGKTADNWTFLGRSTANASSYNFTSIGGYKKYKLVYAGMRVDSGGSKLKINFNGNTSDYFTGNIVNMSNTTSPYMYMNYGEGYIGWLDAMGSGALFPVGYVDIENADSTTGGKWVKGTSYYRNSGSGQDGEIQTQGYWNGTSAITSIQVATTNGTINFSIFFGALELWGCN